MVALGKAWPKRSRRIGLRAAGRLICLLAVVGLVAACAVVPVTPIPPASSQSVAALPVATPSSSVAVAIVSASPTAAPADGRGDEGIAATLGQYYLAIGSDPTSQKTAAYLTLQDFANPHGIYSSAWWMADSHRATIAEVLAVILYTEGNTNWDVRAAVVARYLWYCGGTGTRCQGPALINFLSYFQPWREPWHAQGFTSTEAETYLPLAEDLVQQKAGLLTALVPGADTYVRSADGLSIAGPVDWWRTQFHFANVDPSWDSYLRDRLHRLPNGPANLWVLTMGEAAMVCQSQFVCADMTQPRQ